MSRVIAEWPIWNEREPPLTQIADIGQVDAVAVSEASLDEQQANLLGWANDYRRALLPAFAELYETKTRDQLERWQVSVPEIAAAVAFVTDTNQTDATRIVFHGDAKRMADYRDTAGEGFFPSTMALADGSQAYGQFVSTLNFMRLNKTELRDTSRVLKYEVLAHELGHAALGSITDLSLSATEIGMQPYDWNGYTWRYNDRIYGYVLDEAIAIKVAAETRRELGLSVSRQGDHPLIAPYRLKRGLVPHYEYALLFDILSAATSEPVHKHAWEFAKSGRDGSARETLVGLVHCATAGQVKLEELEALTRNIDDVRNMVERIEEASGLDVGNRISVSNGV